MLQPLSNPEQRERHSTEVAAFDRAPTEGIPGLRMSSCAFRMDLWYAIERLYAFAADITGAALSAGKV
jgi:hypothetical protein